MELGSFELVIDACGRHGLVSEIERLSNAIGCDDNAVDFDLRKQIADVRKIASARQSFIELTEQKLASDEISKSALQSEFVEKYEFQYGKHILDAWLQQLERVGKLKQFKKSGRWWLKSSQCR